MAYDIATPLTHAVLKQIKFERDHGQQFSDSQNRRLRLIPGVYEEFFPSVEDGGDRAVIRDERRTVPEVVE